MDRIYPQQGESVASDRPDDWFESWFDTDFYVKLYSHRDIAEAEAVVSLILGAVELPDGMKLERVLDLASGPGRHAIVMARHGLDVTAVDLSPTLIRFARAEAEREGADIHFVRSDMRRIDFHRQFQLVVQLFTSFGYFVDEREDAKVLDNVREALVVGGGYVLDLINADRLRQTLVARSTREVDGIAVRERRWIDGNRVEKTICIPMPDGTMSEYHESVRLYSPEEIESMLVAARLEPVQWFGDYHGSDYDARCSDRMIVVCRAVE